jgi:[ribosomal protein S5]-alanine N-acetyltransferase
MASTTPTIVAADGQVTLRPVTLDDVTPIYVAWLNDPVVNRYLETRFATQTLETVATYVRSTIANPLEHFFAICLGVERRHVGNIKVGPIKHPHRLADVSLFIGDRDAWGRGVAKVAIGLISRFAIRDLQLSKLSAGVYAPNVGSAKAFLSNGYLQEAVRRKHLLLDDQPIDLLEFGLCADECNFASPLTLGSRLP